VVQEDGRYQSDALVDMKGIIDQPFPNWKVQVICGQPEKKVYDGLSCE